MYVLQVGTRAATCGIDMAEKRRCVVLSLSQKLEIITLLDKSASHSVIAGKYGVGKRSITNIKKNREKILQFKRQPRWVWFMT